MPTDWKQVSKTLKRCMPCNSGGSTCIVQDSNKDGRDYRRLSDLFGHSCQHTLIPGLQGKLKYQSWSLEYRKIDIRPQDLWHKCEKRPHEHAA